ncbi:FAD-dependent monooxygenase [Streptomyces sp. OF3]|uniref:FAD-dependent monooxygenase n=1 Tax=Streptomyces alkaliterrae TaxID=2213162 RepID=A0A7W3ZLN1_9ACTN|nr:FAD-dependent monooxygenase [Streptomyces alkaliterrae]MBB1253029.1 FAD-dependent monooxygenase [Streptomyces alkaliterrae]
MEPVIVVGAGPVGLALALALARQEVPIVLLEAEQGPPPGRPARSCVLRADTAAFAQRLVAPDVLPGTRWMVWRALRRGQVVEQRDFTAAEAPLHLPQHHLTEALRSAVRGEDLVLREHAGRVVDLTQDDDGIQVHTAGRQGEPWRGSYLVGCDGARSTVRKLLGVRFPGRTAVERHAVAALRARLPWPDEALLHQELPGTGAEMCARALPDDVWRLDWLLPPRGELVTPEALLRSVEETLTVLAGESDTPYELLDTGVHTAHQRLARHWRVDRAFLAGDAAHLLGALGTQAVDEGLRDAENLAWKLAMAWHEGRADTLLDSYEAERRGAVVRRLRAVDQALPLVRGGGPLRSLLPGGARNRLGLLTDGHLGRGALGAPPEHAASPLAPPAGLSLPAALPLGGRAADVTVTALSGDSRPLSHRLGGDLLVVLVAPGTGVWDSRHWLNAGVMPELAATVRGLPVPTQLLVAESYPDAPAHTLLVVRPDGHLAAALPGVHEEALRTCVTAVTGGRVGVERPAVECGSAAAAGDVRA